MKVVVLGTGAADGLPQPFCDCATCADARATGTVRSPGGLLVDEVLLIDAPPAVGAAAARAGVDLRRVRTIAVSHAHSDHWDPSILLHRSWQDPRAPLRIIGPESVLHSARGWLAPDSPVELIAAQPGAGLELEQHFLRVLPATHGTADPGQAVDPLAAEAVLFEVLSGDAALLYGADTGPPDEVMLAAVAEAQYDVVLLELTFGAHGPTTPGHLDHATFPSTLARLRDVGAVGPSTDVIAIHLSHHNPPAVELAQALAAWGARAVPDGSHLEYRGEDSLHPRTRAVLITGGARSGKSAYAEGRAAAAAAAADGPVTYLATGWPAGDDPDWNTRIAAHAHRRPAYWRTVETPDPAAALATIPARSTVVLDCLTAWVTRLVDDVDGWTAPDVAHAAVIRATDELISALTTCPAAGLFIVTNEVGSGVVPEHASGRLFRDLLGRVNAALGAVCDEVVLVVAGQPLTLSKVAQQ